jgi:plastocyanin
MNFAKKRTIIVPVVLSIIVIVGIVLLLMPKDNPEPPVQPAENSATLQVANINIGPGSFSPSAITIKKGSSVIWSNTDNVPHRIASNPHPGHSDLPDLYSDSINSSDKYRFTFNTPGTFGYHDEVDPAINGTIIVED